MKFQAKFMVGDHWWTRDRIELMQINEVKFIHDYLRATVAGGSGYQRWYYINGKKTPGSVDGRNLDFKETDPRKIMEFRMKRIKETSS